MSVAKSPFYVPKSKHTTWAFALAKHIQALPEVFHNYLLWSDRLRDPRNLHASEQFLHQRALLKERWRHIRNIEETCKEDDGLP